MSNKTIEQSSISMRPYIPGYLRRIGAGGIIFIVFLILGGVIYFNVLSNPFQYDDEYIIVRNPNIREIRNIPHFFIDPSSSVNDPSMTGHYRPLVLMSYALSYAIGGLKPAAYHLVNLALHAGTAFLIFLIVKAMLESRLIGRKQKAEVRSKKQEARNGDVGFFAALAAGLIFLVHPFNSEAVNYATALSSVMSGFFYLLGFWCWVKYRELAVSSKQLADKTAYRSLLTAHCLPLTAYYYAGSLLAFLAGMLSKEVAVTLPVMLWLYDLYGFAEVRSQKSGEEPAHSSRLTANYLLSWRTYVPYLPFFIMVGIPYLIIWIPSLSAKVSPRLWQRDFKTQLFTELPVLVKHWQMFLLPRGLSLIHDVKIYGSINWSVFSSAILLLIYAGLALYLIRSRKIQWRVVSFFMFWFFIVLLPTTIVPLNAIFQENRGYLAIVSFVVLAGVLVGGLGAFRYRVWVYIGGLVILVGIYSSVTVQRNSVWADSVSLWKDAVEKSPAYGTAYAGLSGAYIDRGDTFLALEVAKKGVLIEPGNYYIRSNLGQIYRLMGNTDKAIQESEKAVEIIPKSAIMWNDLGLLYVRKGDMERAELCLTKASELWGDMPNIYYNLGIIRLGRGKISEAEGALRRAVSLNPTYLSARYELGEVLERLGKFDEAREQYREIISIGSDRSDIWSSVLGEGKRELKDKIVEKARQRLKEGDKS